MNDYRDIELTSQLEKRERIVVVRIATLEARHYPGALKTILLNRALEFPEKWVAAPWHGRSHAVDFPRIFVLLLGVIAVLSLTPRELLRAIHIAQIVNWIGNDGNI